ncbi:n-acetylglutamate synthase [Allofranklinella schreckenbergeri]|uniref:N-acetylglutamate synthase n=1 Tax=Allofranklinella schreckenbergeri TaxID=1076744 RepID=A0A3M6Q649_9BURK|nr:n-acetylglutamate synthase [Allofranklinella schreckenbergeri]RMW97891.1 n-acetylglutamate synthase [Allofranklinella schreckenbergeri]
MFPYDLDGKTFRSVSNTPNGEVDGQTRFHYRQRGEIVTAHYEGGQVRCGQLMARMLPDGRLDMRYHHLNSAGQFMLGQCLSTPERLPDGRLRFHEQWQWLNGDGSSGQSMIEEIRE